MHTAWAPADTGHVRKHQTVALPVRRHGTQTNHVRKHKHRFDCVKYDLGDAPADAQDGPNSIKLTYTMGCIMLVFRVLDDALGPDGFRDFVLVREMRMGIRCAPGAPGRFPRLQCENKIDIDGWDDREAKNKLGRLWTWKDVRGWIVSRCRRGREISKCGKMRAGYFSTVCVCVCDLLRDGKARYKTIARNILRR